MSFVPSFSNIQDWLKIYHEHTGNKNLCNQIFNLIHRALLIKEGKVVDIVRDTLIIHDEEQNMYYCADMVDEDENKGKSITLVRRMVHVTSADNRFEDYYFRIARGQSHSFQQGLERALRSTLEPYITSSNSSYNIKFTPTSADHIAVDYNCKAENFDPKAIREKLIESNFLIRILFHQPFEISIFPTKVEQ